MVLQKNCLGAWVGPVALPVFVDTDNLLDYDNFFTILWENEKVSKINLF